MMTWLGAQVQFFFKSRTQFIKILITVFSVVLALITLFYVYTITTNAREVARNYYDSQENFLQQILQNIHSDLDSAYLLQNNTLYNSYVIKSVINPRSMTYEDSLALVNTLANTVEHSQMITFISYYTLSAARVYESNKSISTLDTCVLEDVWDRYFHESRPYRACSGTFITDIFCDKSGIYLIQGFPRNISNSAAYIMLALNDALFTENVPEANLTVYDSSYRLLYGEDILETGQTLDTADTFIYLEAETADAVKLCYQDSQTGWIFCYSIPSTVPLLFSSAGQNLLVFFLIFLLLGFVISIGLSMLMYRPIYKLVLVAEEHSGNTFSVSESKNEFDYLKSTYTKLVSHQKEMISLFPVIYDSVAEKIFYDLFFDDQTPSKDLAKRFDLLSEKFRFFQQYLVILAVPQPVQANDMEPDMHRLVQLISELSGTTEKLFVFAKEQLGVIIVLGFPASTSAEIIQGECLTLCQNILNAAEPWCTVSFGIGELCTNIADVRTSLEDAKVNLTFNQYMSSLPSSSPAEDDTFSQINHNNLIRRLRSLYDHIETMEEEELQKSFSGIMEEVRLSAMDLEHKKIVCGFFINLLREKYKMLNLSSKNQSLKPILQNEPPEMPELDQEELLIEYVSACASGMLHEISQFYHTPNYNYICLATDFISKNFSDPNLSLEMVSDYIGINSTYLSRIFKNILGQNFLTYVNNCRITHAKNLLKNSELTIQEIGAIVGYASMTTFFRVFKKYTGTTPGNFRQNNVLC